MRNFRALLVFALASTPARLVHTWEVGVGVGAPFYNTQTITNPIGSASASLSTGWMTSAWLGNNLRGSRLDGEMRYDYKSTDRKLSLGSTHASFAANTQAI